MRCPSCGRERCLTPYIDVATGQPVGPEFGRCDHERRCGYDRRPTGKDVGDRELWIPNNEARKGFQYPVEPEVANCIPYREWAPTVSPGTGNKLFGFLSSLYDAALVETVMRRFNVGTMDLWSWKGCPVFWQVDKDFTCRTGKIMDYEVKVDGDGREVDIKRVKEEGRPHVMYYHAVNGRDFVLRQCLFGEHLLNFFPEQTPVNLVESEKTAIIATVNRPDKLFVATGGLLNFRPEVMAPLRKRKVVAFPDKGEAKQRWEKIVRERLWDYDIKVSDAMEKEDECGDGEDLADVIIKKKILKIK